jgi:hypothetical protein
VLEEFLPGACSRLRIFLSYASEHGRIAEALAQTLKNAGHEVFYDKDSLPAGEDYNAQIRAGIAKCDRFVFLVSRSSLEPGRFTLSELGFVKEKWPSPTGRVFPVLLDKTIKPDELPAYLNTVQLISITGNPTAEIANVIDKTRRTRPGVLVTLAAVALGLIAAGITLAKPSLFPVKAEVAYNPPAKLDLRPLIAPPDTGGQGDAWLKSDVAITALQNGYQYLTSAGANAQIRDEQVEIRIDGQVIPFEYLYEVNIMRNCTEGGWHCARSPKALRTLAPGEAIAFQSMYRAKSAGQTRWDAFIDKIATAKQSVSVAFTARVNVDRGGGRLVETPIRHECMLDMTKLQSDIAETRQKRGRIPIIMQPACSYK